MELVIPFKKRNFTHDGINKSDGKFVLELQRDWENNFHLQFNPYYANAIEGHPLTLHRLNKYIEGSEDVEYNFGMELINGEIDIDTNLAIDKFLETQTVYAIGSQLQTDDEDDDNPLFLIKNDKLSEEIILLKYYRDNQDNNIVDYPIGVEVELNEVTFKCL